MLANSRTIAGRPIGDPSWNQVPSRAIRIWLSPQWVGFHFSTGGSRRSSTSRAISASDSPARSAGGGAVSGMGPG